MVSALHVVAWSPDHATRPDRRSPAYGRGWLAGAGAFCEAPVTFDAIGSYLIPFNQNATNHVATLSVRATLPGASLRSSPDHPAEVAAQRDWSRHTTVEK